ncbi:MAG: SDR family oxidoreductase [Dehalococcoidales bacterium]|nr:SDR family oxidoreductase [Dehalococcoidales bacterium]
MNDIPNELKDKNILVTGGAGFVGSHIVDSLSSQNNVIVMDNLFTGLLSNLEKSKDRIKFVKADILDKALVKDIVEDVDYIFHLAAHVGYIRSIKDPYYDMEVNIKGTLNLLEACRGSRVKRLIFSSSAAIYGDVKHLPIDEDHPLYPKSPYAVSKMAAEKYCFAFHKVHGIPVVALRYFNIYGPRQDTSEYANAIFIFLDKFRGKKPITIYGDGEQTRDLIYIRDVVEANILAATHPAAVGGVFNIATGLATTINQLVDLIRQVSGYEGTANYVPFRAGEIIHSQANVEKAGKVLGFRPKTSLKDGLALTWKELTKREK